jgi:oligopeptide transport system permease protein
VTGSVVVERIFAVPGVGEYFVSAALNRDYPMVMGTVVLYATLLIVANIAVDLTYAWLDPRVREEAS